MYIISSEKSSKILAYRLLQILKYHSSVGGFLFAFLRA